MTIRQARTMPNISTGRATALAVIGLAAILFIYHVIADRMTPFSSVGYVRAYLVEIVPEVSGVVREVGAVENKRISKENLLFQIDSIDYDIAVSAAEAKLRQVGQTIGESTAQVAAAQSSLTAANVRFDRARKQSARTLELVEKGIYPKAKGDDAQASLDNALAAVDTAKANLERARQALGPKGDDNPQIQSALVELERASLSLMRTSVTAPADGIVTSVELVRGQFVPAGRPVMTFIDISDVWIVSLFTENNLGRTKIGNKVEIALDANPGEIYAGGVESIGLGVAVGGSSASGMPSGIPDRTLTTDDLRFPVRISLTTDKLPPGVRYGARARAMIYTGDGGLMNWLGWLRIRLVSYWNYIG